MGSILRTSPLRATKRLHLPWASALLVAAAIGLGLPALGVPELCAEEENGGETPAVNPPPGEPAPATPDGEVPAPAAARTPLLPVLLADPKPFKDLVEGARAYFDLDEEPWRGRKGFLDALTKEAEEGRFWLKDMDALRWLVYQSRSFYPPMTDRKWRSAMGIPEYKSLGGTLHRIRSEDLTIMFSIPRDYPKEKDFKTRYPRPDPYPVVLTMHDKRDYTGEKYPGDVLMKRRYPKKLWKDLYDNWVVLCPIAAAGNYVGKDDMIRAEVLQGPLSRFWKHYHVDFDRVILDGTDQAFAAAASQPIYFAGVVFRTEEGSKWGLSTEKMREDVKNFSQVPVYVVDNPDLAAELKAAGHTNVTAGISGPTLFAWMQGCRRVDPKTFKWTAQRIDQVLPYWVNLEATNWVAPQRLIDVEVIDTEENPNTVKIDAIGIDMLALFLNDDVCDLDRKVRVLINGHVEHDETVIPTDPYMKVLGRDFDLLFDRDPARIRISMFFGWLKTARIVQLRVRPPKKEEVKPVDTKEPAGPAATPQEEQEAKRYLQKANVFAEQGDEEKTRTYLEKILELPKNACTDEAKVRLAALEPVDK